MLSKSQFKLIKSLGHKKYRQRQNLFVAEGKKVIQEFLDEGLSLHLLCTVSEFFGPSVSQRILVSEAELQKISFLTTPQTALALFEIPQALPPTDTGLQVVLDQVRDPGTLGTIIRLCDWFGVTDLICSPDTVDCYNPKVVQASMGSLARVQVHYLDLVEFLTKQSRPVFGTFLDGADIYQEALPSDGLLIMGNEANGINPSTQACITRRLTIPQFGAIRETESLNVATATAIALSEFRRR